MENSSEFYEIPEINSENGVYVPPTELCIAPAGEFVARDGTIYRNTNAKILVNKFNCEKIYLAIDFDHRIYHSDGGEASGWIEKLEERGGEIWATQITWLPEAIAALSAKSYRYYSPHYYVNPQTREILRLDVVSLVNRPRMAVPALNSLNTENNNKEKNTMDPNEDLLAALKHNAAMQNEINSLKDQAAENEQLKTKLAELEGEKAAASTEAFKQELNSYLDSQIKEGKLPPAQKDFYAQTVRSQDELNSLKGLFKEAPNLLPSGGGTPTAQPENLDNELNSMGFDKDDLDFARRLGLEPKDLSNKAS